MSIATAGRPTATKAIWFESQGSGDVSPVIAEPGVFRGVLDCLSDLKPRLNPTGTVMPICDGERGTATFTVATTPAITIDINKFAGSWYELASAKRPFSAGLVNTTSVFMLSPDGCVEVVNTSRYGSLFGPIRRGVGSAVPVDVTNARLNLSFSGSKSAKLAGNFWIVDVAPDYSWAIVSNASGTRGAILSRDAHVEPAAYRDLVQKAADKGVVTSKLRQTPQLG